MRYHRNLMLLCILFALWPGAAPGHTIPVMRQQTFIPSPKLLGAVEAYYTAGTVAEMRGAVERARIEGPDTALYHEIAGSLAVYEDRISDAFEHYKAALLDPGNDNAVLHIRAMYSLDLQAKQWEDRMDFLAVLAHEHPRWDVRRTAAFFAMAGYRLKNRTDDMERMRALLGYQPPMAVIGPFDNDGGEGFDTPYPPEQEINTKREYPGVIVPVSWRSDPPVRRYGDLDLQEMMYPRKGVLAYAASAFSAAAEGRYDIRLSVSGPIKVWVNDELVFSERSLRKWYFEGIVIPVFLRRGVNRILIKSCFAGKRDWKLGLAISEPGGAPPAKGTFMAVSPDRQYAVGGPGNGPAIGARAAITMQYSAINPYTARGLHLTAWHLAERGMHEEALRLAEACVIKFPRAVIPRHRQASVWWSKSDNKRTPYLFKRLADKVGDDLIYFAFTQSRLQLLLKPGVGAEKKLKALKKLKKLCLHHPDKPTACLQLSEMYGREKLKEERYRLLRALEKKETFNINIQEELARSCKDMGRHKEAEGLILTILDAWPNHEGMLEDMYRQRLREGDSDGAEQYARKLVNARPYFPVYRQYLGEVLQRQKRFDAAGAAFMQMVKLAPTAPVGYRKLGELYFATGKRDTAIVQLRRALECDPGDLELAAWLNVLDQPEREPWMDDVPDSAMLADIVSRHRHRMEKTDEHAEIMYLLDHAVTGLQSDGGFVEVVTHVIKALNRRGSDRLERYVTRSGRNIRIMRAYSVDTDGEVHDARSIQGRDIRFYPLRAGEVTVVQYRSREPSDPRLSGYFSNIWIFQGMDSHSMDSEYVVWVPGDVRLADAWQGDVRRDITRHGAMKRYSWKAHDMPPFVPERYTPSVSGLMWHMVVSTVPDWDVFRKREKERLKAATLISPGLEAVAREIAGPAETPMEKLYAIQEHLERNIRYRANAGNIIDGLKPRTAAVVQSLGFGDSTESAALFIALARCAGIRARFALVRTNNAGGMFGDVPGPQFNHVVVYVPSQRGIETGVFFDPTGDDLDVQVLPLNITGVRAYVLSEDLENAEWIPVPFQSPDMNFIGQTLTVILRPDGSALAGVTASFKGAIASWYRQAARQKDSIPRMVDGPNNTLLPGAQVKDVQPMDPDNLKTPFEMRFSALVPSLARRNGKQLRLAVPCDWEYAETLTMPRRRSDVFMGVPASWRWDITLTPPRGAVIERLPRAGSVESGDFRFSRRYERKENTVRVITDIAFLSHRIRMKDYPEFRKRLDEVLSMMRDDVVFKLAK